MSFTEYFTAFATFMFLVLLLLFYLLNRRINRLHRTTLNWVDAELEILKKQIAGVNNWKAAIAKELQTVCHDLDTVSVEKLPEIYASLESIGNSLEDILRRTADLEKGIVPDFEQAREAARAVDNFNAGLSGILGFDPIETAKKQRMERNAEG